MAAALLALVVFAGFRCGPHRSHIEIAHDVEVIAKSGGERLQEMSDWLLGNGLPNTTTLSPARQTEVAQCFFEVNILVWKIIGMGFQLESLIKTCDPEKTAVSEKAKDPCIADLSGFLGSWAAIAGCTSAATTVCMEGRDVNAICAASISSVFSTLASWSASSAILDKSCNKTKQLRPWAADRRWAGVASCVISSNLAVDYLAKASFVIKAAASMCPKVEEKSINKVICMGSVSGVLSLLSSVAGSLSSAAAVCGENVNLDASCGGNANTIAGGVASIVGAASGMQLACGPDALFRREKTVPPVEYLAAVQSEWE